MHLDFGLVLCIFLECIFFIYYADTVFYRKKNKILCYAAAVICYALHGFICVFNHIILNTFIFMVINFIILIGCYHIKYKNALFQVIILTILSSASELAVMFFPTLGIDINNLNAVTSGQSLIITVFSCTFYLTGIMILAHLFKNKKGSNESMTAGLLIIPVLTLLIFLAMVKGFIYSNMASIICFTLIVIDLIVFIVNQRMITQSLENAELKTQTEKDRASLEEYTILKEKYEQMRIFHHDFKSHMNALNSLISEGNEKAKEYIKSVYKEESTAQFIDYSNNKMLNIILSQKKEQCGKENIQFVIEPIRANLAFISDMDTVSIFSNLLNNAIESCKESAEKKIYLNIYTENNSFIVIRTENSSDKEPLVIDGHLKTHKDNEELHGIGMNSIRKALTNYNAALRWKYDEKEKFFISDIIFNVPQKRKSSKM